ncbi:MAG: ATP-binding protein [Saccharofermentanales bacterium]
MKSFARGTWIQILITFAVSIGATILAMLIRYLGFSETNIVVLFILSVLVVANLTKGYIYGIIASVIGMFSFNFFFTEPIHTFNVNNKSYVITFAVMLVASILTSTLTSKIVRASAVAGQREKQSHILYQIGSSLAKTASISDVATVSVQCFSNLLDCDAICITTKEDHHAVKEYSIIKGDRSVTVKALSDEQMQQTMKGRYVLAIADQRYQFGLICLPEECRSADMEQNKLLSSIITQISIAMERECLATEKETAKSEAKREKYKSDLLRSISHDIRTPLSGITGAAEVLLYNMEDEDSLRLIQGIYDDSIWLNQMVENILNLTKIQEGTLRVNKQMEVVEEIVGAAVRHSMKFTGTHRITVDIPDPVILVPMDAKLIVQVFINLVENAVKHSSDSDEIRISVTVSDRYVWFSVMDHGTGIKPADLPKVFDLFFVSEDSHTDSRRGNGLGLTICKAIVNAHGGTIIAENNINGGATVRFSLPLEGRDPNGKI